MPKYQIDYTVNASRTAIIEAETAEEARDLWNRDEWLEDYENDSDFDIHFIERIDD